MTKQDSPTTAVPEELLEKLYIYFQRLHVKYDNPFEKTDTAALKDEWYPIVTKAIESYGNSRELEGQAKAHESYMYGSRIFSVPNVVYHFGGEDIPKKFAQLINAESKRRRDETLAAMQSQKGSTNE